MAIKRLKILVVDDDEKFVKIIKLFLEKYGTIAVARNGREGFHTFCSGLKSGEPFDLVCMDLRMPSMNGVESIRHIRKMEAELGTKPEDAVKIIVVSSEENDLVVENSLKSGSEAYVYKVRLKDDLREKMAELGLIKTFMKLGRPKEQMFGDAE